MLDFLKKTKTTDLSESVEKEAYMKEKIKQAEIIGKSKAEAEAKEEIKEIKAKPQKAKTNNGFAKFQDYCTNFANSPSAFGDKNILGGDILGRNKKNSKRSRKGFGLGF